ncbi:MAG: hypothetical protein N0E54_15835 [Candidatus Thiodiazotropha taylori]|nr:hypothetical protein [Candidatus Thiodiazotropha endolucinida]MCW4230210.1 hypothetical protein [Candidatus Thiodiazotropha taylori]
MKKYKPGSDEAVREAMENLNKDTPINEVLDLVIRDMKEKSHRNQFATFLISRLNRDFLYSNSHVPALGGEGTANNEQAVRAWADKKLDENHYQLKKLTSEFMVDTYYELTEILSEHQYL